MKWRAGGLPPAHAAASHSSGAAGAAPAPVKRATACSSARGCSRCAQWPHSSTHTSSACGSVSTKRCA